MSDRIDDAKAIAIDVFGEDDVIRRVDAVEALAEWGISPLVLMPVPPARQWIPCSERLPEHDGRYLCTNNAWGEFMVDWNAWCDNQWLFPNAEPIAWMPLPEPFREDGGTDEHRH